MGLASRSVRQLVAWRQCTGRTLATALVCHSESALASSCSLGVQSLSTDASKTSVSILAACVLERLPIVKSPPPEWEADYKAWTQQRKAGEGMIKQYPLLDKKQKARDDSDQTQLKLVPSVTKADEKGVVSTMKRRLADKLVLLIKARQDPKAAVAATGGQAAAAVSRPLWTFPYTAHKEGETIRDTAERALKEAIGPAQVYFIGNAPMAHLELKNSSSSRQADAASAAADAADAPAGSSSRSKQKQRPAGRLYFHLATVVNDPWDVNLSDAAASDHAWVSKDELEQYIKDERLLALAHKML